jgi:hypothetical protein
LEAGFLAIVYIAWIAASCASRWYHFTRAGAFGCSVTRFRSFCALDRLTLRSVHLRDKYQGLNSQIGATAPILGYGALNALLFVTYNRSLELLSSGSPPSYTQIYISGVLGGLATFVVSAPTELIKVRAQVANSSSSMSTISSSFGIAREMLRREGIRGLYLGGGVTAARDAIGYGF